MQEWTLTRVRPTSGSEFVRSRHFPESAQGNFLFNNTIGFQGIKQYKTVEDGSGFVGVEVEPLLQSTDPNFRPVAMQFGPDGALYVDRLVQPAGRPHAVLAARSAPRQDARPRLAHHREGPAAADARRRSTARRSPQQLDLLKAYEDRTRYQARLRAARSADRARCCRRVQHVDRRPRRDRRRATSTTCSRRCGCTSTTTSSNRRC